MQQDQDLLTWILRSKKNVNKALNPKSGYLELRKNVQILMRE